MKKSLPPSNLAEKAKKLPSKGTKPSLPVNKLAEKTRKMPAKGPC